MHQSKTTKKNLSLSGIFEKFFFVCVCVCSPPGAIRAIGYCAIPPPPSSVTRDANQLFFLFSFCLLVAL